MKLALQALFSSLLIHVIYIGVSIIIGYIKTKNELPDLEKEWQQIQYLETNVAFGYTLHPTFTLLSILGLAIAVGLCLYLFKKHKKYPL